MTSTCFCRSSVLPAGALSSVAEDIRPSAAMYAAEGRTAPVQRPSGAGRHSHQKKQSQAHCSVVDHILLLECAALGQPCLQQHTQWLQALQMHAHSLHMHSHQVQVHRHEQHEGLLAPEIGSALTNATRAVWPWQQLGFCTQLLSGRSCHSCNGPMVACFLVLLAFADLGLPCAWCTDKSV